MRIYFSNMSAAKGLEDFLPFKIRVLVSYYGLPKSYTHPLYASEVFLDSGAFSAMRQRTSVDIRQYASFLKERGREFEVCASLDVIGDERASWKNQRWLESQGLDTLPCWHNGESSEYLGKYLRRYDYIGLGGVVVKHTTNSRDKAFSNFWRVARSIRPDARVHLYGVTTFSLLHRFPWYSADSSSIHMQARYGGVATPWGWMKVNPNVSPREAQWQRGLTLQRVNDWFDEMNTGFSFASIREQTTEGTLKRCATSIIYLTREFEKSNPDIKLRKSGFFS